MIKADGRSLVMEGSMVGILQDFTHIVEGMNEMLHGEFGDKADDIMVLLGRFAVSKGKDRIGYGEAIAKMVFDLVEKKFKENEDGKKND